MIRQTYLTREGYEKMRKELDYLKNVRRREISKEIGVARAHGDLSENAEYDAAREAQAMVEKRIPALCQVRIIEDENIPDDKVYIGAKVRVRDLTRGRELNYMLVSEVESDSSQGKISTTAPIGRGLLGCEEGDIIEIKVPAGILEYEILEISR